MRTKALRAETVLGKYCGTIVAASRLTKARVQGGFVLRFSSRSDNDEAVFVDAMNGGGICHFVNHSCAPNTVADSKSDPTETTGK
jgi:hypothetical protein